MTRIASDPFRQFQAEDAINHGYRLAAQLECS